MIEFETITIQNFLSIGDSPCEIVLNKTATTLIVGKNGHGKSLLIDALHFVCFNKAYRKINRPLLVNSVNAKNCLVTLNLKIDGVQYKIIRGIKPNIFEIWKNGSLVNQESHNLDYQTVLENEILKMNMKSFRQIVVLGSRNFIPFMQLPTWHRREVVEDLLDISVFTSMNQVLKERMSKHKEQIQVLENNSKLLNEKINLAFQHLSKIQELNSSNIDKYQDEINTLTASVDELNNEIVELQAAVSEMTRVSERERDVRGKVKKFNDLKVKIEHQMESMNFKKKFFLDTDCCPECSQTIDTNFREQKLEECDTKHAEMQHGITKLKDQLNIISTEHRKLQDKMLAISSKQSDISAKQTLITNYHKRIKFLNEQIKNQSGTKHDASSRKALVKLQEELTDTKSTIERLNDDSRYYSYIQELLKDSGIKSQIIKKYLPVMNHFINHYLQTLDFFCSFELDENFSEKLRSRHRDEFTYDSFSEGEKSRIDLALLITWRQIAKAKNSTNTNLLILDEVFDGSLDGDGVDNLIKIMNTFDDGTNVFVITHKPETFESYFNRKLSVTKTGLFSEYSEEILSV